MGRCGGTSVISVELLQLTIVTRESRRTMYTTNRHKSWPSLAVDRPSSTNRGPYILSSMFISSLVQTPYEHFVVLEQRLSELFVGR